MLLGVKRKILKEMLGYYITETGGTPSRYIIEVQKYQRGQDTDEYSVWLAGEINKVISKKGIELIEVLQYTSIADTLETVKEMWLEKEIREKTKDTIYKVDFAGGIQGFEDKSEVDFINTIDFGVGTEAFKTAMGTDFEEVLESKESIYFNIDATKKGKNRVIEDEMLLRGYSKEESRDIGVQTLFRVLLLREHYNPENMTVGILNDVASYKNPKYTKILEDFYMAMEYEKGYCFEPRVVGKRSKQELLSYTIWVSRKQKNKHVRRSIEMQEVSKEGKEVKKGKTRLIRSDFEGIYDWMNIGQDANILGYVYASKNTLRILRRIETVTEEPTVGYINVTTRNIMQVAAANAVRINLKEHVGVKPMVLSSPDTTIEGYTAWLSDAIILYIYGNTLITKEGKENRFYPLDPKMVSKVTGKQVKAEKELQNQEILQILEQAVKHCSEEAQSLKMYVERVLIASYKERARGVYIEELERYDTGVNNIREYMPGVIDEEEYMGRVEALKERLYIGIDKYGFNSI